MSAHTTRLVHGSNGTTKDRDRQLFPGDNNSPVFEADLSALERTALATSRDYPGLEFAVDVTELVGAPHSVEVRYEHAPDATAPDARHMGIVLDGVLHTGESFDAHTEHFGFARRHWSLGAADASRLVVGHAFAEGDYVANVAVRLHDADGLLMHHEETVRSAYAQDEFGRNHHSVAVARGGHLLAVGARRATTTRPRRRRTRRPTATTTASCSFSSTASRKAVRDAVRPRGLTITP